MISQWFLPLALFAIMLTVGLSLRGQDFSRVVKQPRVILLGLLLQLLLLPLLGVLVVLVFQLPPLPAVGLLILTLAPGGATSNAITLLARGDAALSVSLTAVTSLITPFTLPLGTALLLNLWLGDQNELAFPVFKAIGQMLLITLLPVGLGMLLRWRWPQQAQRLGAPCRALALLLMLMTVTLLVYSSWHLLPALLPLLAAPVLVLVMLAMLSGQRVAHWAGVSSAQQVTLTVEVGLQNAGMALLVTGTLLQSQAMSASALVYGVLMQAPALALIVWCNRDRLRTPRRAGAVR